MGQMMMAMPGGGMGPMMMPMPMGGNVNMISLFQPIYYYNISLIQSNFFYPLCTKWIVSSGFNTFTIKLGWVFVYIDGSQVIIFT